MFKAMLENESMKTYIFVAGNAKQMPQDVEKSFTEAFKIAGLEDADSIVPTMKKLGLYQTEVWS